MTQSLLDSLLARGRARQPLIGAHRGASATAPENTLAAFRQAVEDGADLIELDVHRTRDGQLAVIHDALTRRTTGVPGRVATMDMARLRRLDAGSYKSATWRGEGIPSLPEVFALTRERVLVNVEIKGGMAVLPVLAGCLAAEGMRAQVIVSSFDRMVVAAAAALRPAPLVGLLLERPRSGPGSSPGPEPGRHAIAAARALGASLLHLEHTTMSEDLVARAHDAGLAVLAWTVNEPAEMRRLAALGVDAILSDDPRLLRATVGELPA